MRAVQIDPRVERLVVDVPPVTPSPNAPRPVTLRSGLR